MGVYLSCYDIVTELNIFLGKNNGKRKFYLKTEKSAKKYGKLGRWRGDKTRQKEIANLLEVTGGQWDDQ